jgi:hypothetical protein
LTALGSFGELRWLGGVGGVEPEPPSNWLGAVGTLAISDGEVGDLKLVGATNISR